MKYENFENNWKKRKYLIKFPLKISITMSFKIVSSDKEKKKVLLLM